jgi:D-alanyl-D-alanine carboxypeptidase
MKHSDSHPGLRRTIVCIVSILALLSVAAPAHGTGRSDLAQRVQRALDRVVAAGAPGATAVVRVGARTFRLSSGRSNLSPVEPMRTDLPARIGGVTKTYTATVVLQLVAEHRLRLDDTVEKWLPGAIPTGAGISVRQLLNHTSGVFDYVKDPRTLAPYLDGDWTRTFNPADGVRYAAEHEPLFPPGTALNYSNTNYLLLAMIVETITGRSIGAELRRRIFAPLGLARTSYPTSSEIAGRYVHGYIADATPPVDITPLSPTVYAAAGAILSSADDVARFYRALLGGHLLPPRFLREMQTIDPVATGGIPDAGILGGGWGLGLLREEYPCGEAWGHDAEHLGYMAAAWTSRHATRQVVVIVNSGAFDHDAPVSAAMRDVLVTAYCDR